MKEEGPPLEALTRRLAECPAEFLAEPCLRVPPAGGVHVAAVVSDLLRDLAGAERRGPSQADRPGPEERSGLVAAFLASAEAGPFEARDPAARNRLRTVLVAAWLLHDSWFRDRRTFSLPARRLLEAGLDDLAVHVAAPALVSDPDRREELARRCLAALGLRPAGESLALAEDRLHLLDSVERARVLVAMRAAEERARQIREAMARTAAQESVASYAAM